MLDGLLGRGFSFKCKSVIKGNRARMEVVRRRAEAKQRFLKEDLVKLLSNGLDINAYGRTDEYLAGMNLLSCYDFIEQSCEFIVKQSSRMQKQGDCPEECREAVASLMFAAARFSDLPELRDLRDTFQERYGNCFEAFVSQKFVEKLSSKPPTAEKKLQALQDIASEFALNWDSRGFEQRMAAPSVVAKVHAQKAEVGRQKPALVEEKNRGKRYEGGNLLRRDESDHSVPRRQGPTEYRENSLLKREDNNSHMQNADIRKQKPVPLDEKCRQKSYSEDNVLRRDEFDHHLGGSLGPTDYREKSLSKRGESSLRGDDEGSFRGRRRQAGIDHSYLSEHGMTESKSDRSSSNSLHGGVLDNAHVRYAGQSNGISNPGKAESTESLFREKAGFAPYRPEHLGKTEKSVSAFDYNQNNTVNSIRNTPEEESDRLKSCSNYALPPPYVKSKDKFMPPPYTKSKEDKHRQSRGSKHGGSDLEGHSFDPSSCKTNVVDRSDRFPNEPHHRPNREESVEPDKAKTYNEKQRPSRSSKHAGSDFVGHSVDPSSCKTNNLADHSDRFPNEPQRRSNREEQCVVPEKTKAYDENEIDFQGDKFSLPKPRSSRRKHHKSSTGYEVEGIFDDTDAVKRSSSSKRKDSSRKGMQILFDEDHRPRKENEVEDIFDDSNAVKRSSSSRRKDSSRKGMQILYDEDHRPRKDDEERMIDKLLIHYSKKPAAYDAEKIRKKLPPGSQRGSDVGESSFDQSKDEHREKYEVVGPPPTRSVSLPHEQTASPEVKKVFTRMNTFQPDNPARHVHPKLPDYDDLAARFAALKGR